MKLALVSPFPPLPSPVSGLALELAKALSGRCELELFTEAPEKIDPFGMPVQAAADLPARLAAGEIDMPVYLLADDLHHAFQVRYVREHPGIMVFDCDDEEEFSKLVAALPQEPGLEPAFYWKHNPAFTQFPFEHGADPGVLLNFILEHAELAAAGKIGGLPFTPPDLPSVEVCMVSYNSKKIIAPCLEALVAQDYPNLKITVLDNASKDGTAAFVRETFPTVNVIASYENLGFSGGNNKVIAETDAKYVVLMNQDAIPRANCIREMVKVAEMADDIAGVGAKMMMRRCPTIINSAGIRMNQGGFGVDGRVGEKDDDPDPSPKEVFGACGGAVLFRASTFRELGGFDETFFMYFEDLDFAWRCQIAGYRILLAPLAVVHHDWHGDLDQEEDEQAGADVADERTRRRRTLCERNRLQCVIKNYEKPNLRKILPQLKEYDRIREGWMRGQIARGDAPDYPRMVMEAMRGSWRWCRRHWLGLWWRRRKVQKLRKRRDAEITLIEPGIGEPSYIGQLEIIQDRHSARAKERIEMGSGDDRCLGPGWYAPEPLPDQGNIVTRWTKAKAWFYLKSEDSADRLVMRVGGGLHPSELAVYLGSTELGGVHLDNNLVREITFLLPEPAQKGKMLEFHLECSKTFVPREEGQGEDERILGLRVAEARLVS